MQDIADNAFSAPAGSDQGQKACPNCGVAFEPRRPHQRFCRSKCRVAWYAAHDGGLRGAVVSVRVLKRGKVSVVLQFGLEERDRALQLTPGSIVEVRE